MRLTPLPTLRCSNLGLNRLGEIFSPPWAAPPARATPAAASSIGAAAPAAPPAASPEHLDRAVGLGPRDHLGQPGHQRLERAAQPVDRHRREEAERQRRSATRRRPAERGDLPLLATACLRRCGVGFSVFCDLSSATRSHPQTGAGGAEALDDAVQDRADRTGQQADRDGGEARVSRILTGKLIANDVQRRDRPAEQAQRRGRPGTARRPPARRSAARR